MGQEINFAALPGTQPIGYPNTVLIILGEVARSSPTPKAFKEFLRMRNLYDKASFETLMSFLDIKVAEPKVTLGPFAKRLFDAEDEPAMRKLMAERLISLNPLLAKYCLEAMDTEHGGRLHSTNELYRMITSYVYPGTKPTLPSFRAWVEWAVASGLFKLVGIRWALGDNGKEFLPRLRALDVEEFLEEEASRGEAPEEAEEEATEIAPQLEEQPRTETEVAKPEPVEAPRAEEGPRPPEGQEGPPQPQKPSRPIRLPTLPPLEPQIVIKRRKALSPEDLATTSEALVAWYEGYPGRRPFGLPSLGLEPSSPLPSLAFAALLVAKGVGEEVVRDLLTLFRDKGVLIAASRGKIPHEAIHNAMTSSPNPETVTACEAIVHLPRLAEASSEISPLIANEDPRVLLWGLWRTLYEPYAPLAPFVLARLLFEANKVKKGAASAAFIPFFTVRLNAFRIGFLDRVVASSFAELVDAGVSLGERFGPPSFEGPLAQVQEAFGCEFGCRRQCPFACREKSEVAPENL